MDSDGAEPGEMTPDGQKRKTGASLSNTDGPEPARLAGTGRTDLKIAGLGDPARGFESRASAPESGWPEWRFAYLPAVRRGYLSGDTPDRRCSMLSVWK